MEYFPFIRIEKAAEQAVLSLERKVKKSRHPPSSCLSLSFFFFPLYLTLALPQNYRVALDCVGIVTAFNVNVLPSTGLRIANTLLLLFCTLVQTV